MESEPIRNLNIFSNPQKDPLPWQKHEPARLVDDGSLWLVGLWVRNSETKEFHFEAEVVWIMADEDTFRLTYPESGESYDAWAWEDFQYSVRLK